MKTDCQWGTCDGEATHEITYPDGTVIDVCDDCEPVARAEVEHLYRELRRDADEEEDRAGR